MTVAVAVVSACALVALGFCAGLQARAGRAAREVASSAYVMCGLMMALRKGLEELRFDELRDSLTMQARSQLRVWRDTDGVLPHRDLAIDTFVRQAQAEFSATAAQ